MMRTSTGMARVPPARSGASASWKVRRMLATSAAATATSVICPPSGSRQRIAARSLRQNSRATRFSAGGFTFQQSPDM